MRWRKSRPALRWGDIRFLDTAEPVLAFTRSLDGVSVLVVFNLADTPIDIGVPRGFDKAQPLDGHGLLQGHRHDDRLRLPGYGVWFARVE